MASSLPKSYPRLPAKVWWALRDEFKRSTPRNVDIAYLAAKLVYKEKSASNLLPVLRTLGLIDETGKPTPLVNQWRDDEGYKDACSQMLARVYPDVLDAFPPPGPDRAKLERWFAQTTGAGEDAAKQMAAFYGMVASADLSARPEKPGRANAEPKKPASGTRTTRPANGTATIANATVPNLAVTSDGRTSLPALHIDVQIHIDSSASPEQIDQIFASMSRHLYQRKGE